MLKNNRFILNCVLAFSIITLSVAYFIQYALGHKPCNLCLIERIPYFSAVILISLIFMIRQFEKPIIMIMFLLFVFGTIVSFYHVGIEQGFFDESFVCKLINSNESLSKDQLLKQLESAPISCKDVTFRFLGLSLATINTIISILISVMMFKLFKNYGKNK